MLSKSLYTLNKKVNVASNIVSAGLVIIGSVAGGITANPIFIGTVTGAGVLLKTFCETKNYKRKIEMSKIYNISENISRSQNCASRWAF